MSRLARSLGFCGALVILVSSHAAAQAPVPENPPRLTITAGDRMAIENRLARLEQALAVVQGQPPPAEFSRADLAADVAIYAKAARWILREGEFFRPDDARLTITALGRGLERSAQLAAGSHPWTDARGGSIRGFVSQVDGSVQPYAIYVPATYDPAGRSRLDVVLHGRGATLTEVRFIAAHDGKPMPPGETGLVLHVYGRGNNAYRWAGETDVFEAIAAVKRNFRVDDRRILLRGFSMGGAGAWHLGLHHPSLWCAVEAGAGFTETVKYARLADLPPYQVQGLHIYDALDVAANAFNVPIAGYGGEIDPQLQASQNIRRALEADGSTMKTTGLITRADTLDFLQVVGAQTAHRIDPASEAVLKTFRDEHAARGLVLEPRSIRFVTYSLKYNRAAWLSIESLREQNQRTSVAADLDGEVATVRAENVEVLAIDRHVAATVRLGDRSFPLRTGVKGLLPQVYFRRTADGWKPLDYEHSRAFQENQARGKRHKLHGPIDDAFTAPFLCVRGTGQAWNADVRAWSEARLARFATEWRRWMRGELPIKNDNEITPEDIERSHLILFGDPGSNALIARVLPALPLTWTRQELVLHGRFDSAHHAPAIINANPLNPLRYVVINSGHTFGDREFAGTNALLFPHLGDYAVLRIGNKSEDIVASGYCDESWMIP